MKISDLRKQDEETHLFYKELKPGDIFEFILENNTFSQIFLCLRIPKNEKGDIFDIKQKTITCAFTPLRRVRVVKTELLIHPEC